MLLRLFLIAWVWAAPAYAHDFYADWKTVQGHSCCNRHDCRPWPQTALRQGSQGLEANIEGQWMSIPPEAIRPYQAPDMGHHLCHIGKRIVCFVYGGGA